jgi:hypothetical protein
MHVMAQVFFFLFFFFFKKKHQKKSYKRQSGKGSSPQAVEEIIEGKVEMNAARVESGCGPMCHRVSTEVSTSFNFPNFPRGSRRDII